MIYASDDELLQPGLLVAKVKGIIDFFFQNFGLIQWKR